MSKIKPGMLCVVRNKNLSTTELAGRFVTVVRKPKPTETFVSTKGKVIQPEVRWSDLAWVCISSSALPWNSEIGINFGNFTERVINESVLQPIEDNDGEDEMLSIVGKPPEIKLKENV